jgi:hypothetical protein
MRQGEEFFANNCRGISNVIGSLVQKRKHGGPRFAEHCTEFANAIAVHC